MSTDGIDIKEKALAVIEELTCNDDFGLSDDPMAKLLTQIYCFVHIARGHCENPHEDWKKELEECWEHFFGTESKAIFKSFVIETMSDEKSGKVFFAARCIPMGLTAYGDTKEEATRKLKEMFSTWADLNFKHYGEATKKMIKNFVIHSHPFR